MTRDASPPALRAGPQRIAQGWTESHCGNALALVHDLGVALRCPAEVQETATNVMRFTVDLSAVPLRGLGERTRCLLAGGTGEATALGVQEFWKKEGVGSTHLPLFFCASEEAGEEAGRVIPSGCALLLGPGQVRALLDAECPILQLKKFLCQQVSRRRLSIYDISLPVTGGSFFGRQRELSSLADNRSVSFAIPGAGRIGKSSLLKQYKWKLVRSRDPRANQVREIDFYAFGSADPDSVARHVALIIQANSQAGRVKVGDLVAFLRQSSDHGRQPLELLLDEVDEVCSGPVFGALGQAAKEGYARLIMAGKHCLYDFARGSESVMQARLELLCLGPLETREAHALIRQPLRDLGLTIRDPERVIEHVANRTGGLPHLIQTYCRGLVDLTVERGTDEISFGLLMELENKGALATYFLSFLTEIRDRQAAALARAILRAGRPRLSLADLAQLAGALGQDQDPTRLRRLADTLVIQNVLLWEGVHYRPANQALRYFAEHAGLLA